MQQFRERYGGQSATLTKGGEITKWDIFYYVYGVLHHPGYRTKFADNLKRELPRIPFCAGLLGVPLGGERSMRLHLEYESLEPWPLDFVTASGGVSPLILRRA